MRFLSVFLVMILSVNVCFGQKIEGKSEKGSLCVRKPDHRPDLSVENLEFIDQSGNQVLDAGETANLQITIENRGRGKAVGVTVELVPITSGSKLSFNRKSDIGTVEPNSSRTVVVPISAPIDVPSEQVEFRIEILEEFGHGGDPFTYPFRTRAYEAPQLAIDVEIDDDNEGASHGDGDREIERGETIEVTCVVRNTGSGDAVDVKTNMMIDQENVNYIGRQQYNLGDIPSGAYRTFDFNFWISPRYDKSEVDISVELIEGKWGSSSTRPLRLPVGKPYEITEKLIDVDRPPENSLTELKDGWCVIFGIEEHRYAPRAAFAERDAVIFRAYARSVFGIPEDHIYFRINDEATKAEFDKVFRKDGWLAKRVERGKSDVLFYFSGHGAPDPETREPYLIPWDSDPNYTSAAFPLDDIYRNLSSLGARSVTIFLDACFSGESKKEVLFPGARPIGNAVIKEPSGDTTVFFASSGKQMASVHAEKKHGLFTYYLLRGLQGYGDLNEDKEIRVGELSRYIRDSVRREALSLDIDREQIPQLRAQDTERVLVIMQ